MFIKRAKGRPSLRARESELPDTPAGSPLGKSSITLDNVASPSGDISMLNDEEDGGAIGSVMERKKAQKKEKRKDGLGSLSKPPKARLSFGGDEDESGEGGTPFKPRKSLLSQSIKLPQTPTAPTSTSTPTSYNGNGNGESSTTPASTSTSSGIYSREYLSQLKAATPTRAPKQNDDDDDDDSGTGLSKVARSKYASTLVEDTTAGIPDDAAITAAKQKRQAALESQKYGGTEEDYISLGGGKIAVYDGNDGPHPESRLMREEDEMDDGDEDMAEFTEAKDKLYLGKNANKAAARRMRGEMGELIADREAEDEDEETREWERAQAQRAGGWEDEISEKVVKRGYQPAPIPIARPIPTISSAETRIAKALADLEVTREESEQNLEVTARELASLEQQEQELRQEVEKVEGKREWVEEFRGWVETLGNFLEEKFPKLEDIEADSLHHLKERAILVNKRREADDSDDLSLFVGVPAPAAQEEEEVDELGRSRPTDFEAGPSSGVRRGRRSERESRRTRRKATSTRTSAVNDEDGFSTDSTLADGDAEDYAAAQHRLEKRVVALLDDVKAEDFRDPEKGLAVRFGGWRKRYEEEYVNAFGGLALVQAWEFYARGEMVGWEPLRGSTSLDSFTWFHALYKYSRPPPSHEHAEDDMDIDDEHPIGPDGDLVASMVSSAVVPILTKAFEAGAYDPYSAPQTRRAVDLADVVADLMGKDSRKYTSLLKSVLLVYHNHLLELSSSISNASSSTAIAPPAFDPASRGAMERYVRRRMKLLRNMLLWRREAQQEIRELVTRLVGEVLRPILSRTWEGGGKEMAQKVLQVGTGMLPPDLVGFLQQGPASRW